jgi:hypothetical protein
LVQCYKRQALCGRRKQQIHERELRLRPPQRRGFVRRDYILIVSCEYIFFAFLPNWPCPYAQALNCDNSEMARGWESKSIEAQQAEAGEKPSAPRSRLSPEEAANRRKREVLRLSRQRITQQLATVQNPQHRKMLEEALAELDRKLSQG